MASYNVLDKLFGSRVRVKLLKLMYRNYPGDFSSKDLAKKIQETSEATRKELNFLAELGLVNKKKAGGDFYFSLNPDFELFWELKTIILKPLPAEVESLSKKIAGVGRVRLAILAGIFMDNEGPDKFEAPADLFIVGDDINKAKLRQLLASMEADVGKEIRFTLMDKDEFQYRYGMFDRFIRVLLEGPHQKIINKLGI